ncbi:MAG: TIGR00269 family protein [Thermoplasmata archaeon]
MLCSRCRKEAVTLIRYNGEHLCDEHFLAFFEKRVKSEISRQCRLRGRATIAVALSGGKDSTVAALLLQEIFAGRKDLEIHAITVDEGICDYRPRALKLGRRFCEERGIPHHIIRFEETFGLTMDEIVERDPKTIPCAYCGVLRRYCLNVKAREIGGTVLSTGLNLDDTSQSILMNLARGDVERLARLGPHANVQPGLVPRIQPLRMIPEKETYLYALLRGIEIYEMECPHSGRAQRGRFREVIDILESESPGTRHSILSAYDSLAPLLLQKYPPGELNECKACGEPTGKEVCRACEMLERLRNIKIEGSSSL